MLWTVACQASQFLVFLLQIEKEKGRRIQKYLWWVFFCLFVYLLVLQTDIIVL